MANNPADQFYPRPARSHMSSSGDTARRRGSRARMPSSAGYMIAAVGAAACLFFALWWMLVMGGDEAPWIPAGLAAGVVLLVALSAREVVMRRAWTRYLLEHGVTEGSSRTNFDQVKSSKNNYSSGHTSALKNIQTQAAEAEAGSVPELHLEVFHLCQNYLASTEETLRSNSVPAEKRNVIRSGQERARVLEKHHLLTWARDSSRSLTHEAQRRARVSDKVDTANR
ncbi:MAG: hypothetical protein ABJB97_08085, partial [Acidobacteriota bacterium]